MSYQKTINPAFAQVGKRRKLTGYLAELHDGNMLLHSQEYSTTSQAEQALDTIVYDLLTDMAEHGLVDDVPAALEAEQVSSTHLPIWQGICSEPDNHCAVHDPCPAHAADAARYLATHTVTTCQNCQGSHHTWQCPEIGDLLLAEPVVMVLDVEYAPFGFAG